MSMLQPVWARFRPFLSQPTAWSLRRCAGAAARHTLSPPKTQAERVFDTCLSQWRLVFLLPSPPLNLSTFSFQSAFSMAHHGLSCSQFEVELREPSTGCCSESKSGGSRRSVSLRAKSLSCLFCLAGVGRAHSLTLGSRYLAASANVRFDPAKSCKSAAFSVFPLGTQLPEHNEYTVGFTCGNWELELSIENVL